MTQFQREFAGIVLRAGDLAAPNQIADPLLRPYAHQFLDTLGPPAEVSMVARVRALIETLLPAGHCSIVQVARSLGVDRRTVQRRLADSGETFSSLRDAVRAELAERLVPNPRRSLTEIAEELGFSEPSAFSRWFRRRLNAMIVLDDANLDLAVEGALWGAFGTTGQRCTATSRIILHKKIAAEFSQKLVARADALKWEMASMNPYRWARRSTSSRSSTPPPVTARSR